MKSSGIECFSTNQQHGQHEFLFSLRSLSQTKKSVLDTRVDFSSKCIISDSTSNDKLLINYDSFNASALLPCFSKGCQSQFTAFCTVSEKHTFQSWNKKTIAALSSHTRPQQLEKQLIVKAKPTFTFCQICKESFSDYLKHLQHPVHVKKFQQQRKNNMLDNLLKTINKSNRCKRGEREAKYISQDQQLISSSCKIRVIQLQDTLTPMRVNPAAQPANKPKEQAVPLPRKQNAPLFQN